MERIRELKLDWKRLGRDASWITVGLFLGGLLVFVFGGGL